MPIILKNNSGPVILDGVNVSEVLQLIKQSKEFTEILDWYKKYQKSPHYYKNTPIEPFHDSSNEKLLKLAEFISALSTI